MKPVSIALGLGLFFVVGGTTSATTQQDDDGVYLEEVRKEFLDGIAKLIETKNWKGLFSEYAKALGSKERGKLVHPRPEAPTWCSIIEYLHQRFAKLPAEAFKQYRLDNDGKARVAYQKAMAARDWSALERLVEEYAFAEVTDEALDALARHYFEERRSQEAVYFWRRLLEQYPDSSIPRPLTAACLAMAAHAWPNEQALDEVRRLVREEKISGSVWVGGEEMMLQQFLDSLSIPRPTVVVSGEKLPLIPEQEGRFDRTKIGVRNQVKRWTLEFGIDSPRPGVIKPAPDPSLTYRSEFPFLPAYARMGSRDIVFFNDGSRITAMNPSRASQDKPEACVYWRFPADHSVKPEPGGNAFVGNAFFTQPLFGVSVDGDTGFAVLYSEKKLPERGQQNQERFRGSCRLRAFKLTHGERRWDTDDEELHALYRKLDFYDRNWTFSAPPVVRGDRLYVGVSTSPVEGSDSRVLCVDRRTGCPLWSTYLGSDAGRGNAMMGNGLRLATYLTMVAEEGGIVYVHSNIGFTAALHSVTGRVLWLTRYPRAAVRPNERTGIDILPDIRPVSPVLLHRGRMYTLPQDSWEWQVFNMSTGERIVLVPLIDKHEIRWQSIYQLVGIMEDWIVLGGGSGGGASGGTESLVVNLVDRYAWTGEVRQPAMVASARPRSDVSRCGRGTIVGESIYLPIYDPSPEMGGGALSIYHGVGNFKLLDCQRWQKPDEYGNLLVAGDYLIVATQKAGIVYTDEETIHREFEQRLVQSPPSAAAFLEYGDIMSRNDRLVKAAESYLAFVRAAEGDPQYDQKVRQVRTDLHTIFMKRGAEAAQRPNAPEQDLLQAIEYYKMAQGFAYDAETTAEATRRLAETYEKLARLRRSTPSGKESARQAVEEYQRIVEELRESYHAPNGGEVIQKLWVYAQTRIRELTKEFGDEVYAPIERKARETFEKAKEGSAEALRKVTELYPDSKAAREAWERLLQELEKMGDVKQRLSALREMIEKFPEKKLELQRKITEALEKLFDWERLSVELERMATEFGDREIKVDETRVRVKEYVAQRLKEIQGRQGERGPHLRGPLRLVGEIEGGTWTEGSYQLPGGRVLRGAQGLRPPGLDPEWQFFSCGSQLEVWSVLAKKKIWSVPHPGGYLGALYRESNEEKDNGVVLVEVLSDSPAARAGLQSGDVVVQVGTCPARVESFDQLLAECSAGARVSLAIRRGGKLLQVDVPLGVWPAEKRPGIIGIAFTREYQLAVVWEDVVQGIDVESGRPLWTFRSIRDRAVLTKLYAQDGRLFLHEHVRLDRMRSPFRAVARSTMPSGEQSNVSEQSRVICLNDAMGEVYWARSFSFDAKAASQHAVEFFGQYFGDTVALYLRSYRGGNPVHELVLLDVADGGQRRQTPLGSTLWCWTVDQERGVFTYIVNERETPSLRGLRLWGAEAAQGVLVMDVPLKPKHVHLGGTWVVLARGDWIVLVVAPVTPGGTRRRGEPMGGEAKVTIFSAKTGKEIATVALPEGRFLVPNRMPTAALDPEGTLYLYTVPEATGAMPGAGRERRAYLSAWRLGEGEAHLVWEAIAPRTSEPAEIDLAGASVIFESPGASLPGESANRAVACFYGVEEGGYVRMVLTDLASLTSPFGGALDPVRLHEGRVYVHTSGGVQVYGD